MFYKRKIFSELEKNLNNKKILILTGARQVGKTSLMKMLQERLPKDSLSAFLDMDIVSNRSFGESLENFLNFLYLNGYSEKSRKRFFIFVDEFQKAPLLGNIFKNIYDHYENIKIIASGSSSLSIKDNIKESLAGRKFLFDIYPLDFEEFLEFKNDSWALNIYKNIHKLKGKNVILPAKMEKYLNEFLTFGGYPEVVLAESTEEKIQILKSIFDLYLEKDIIGFSNIENTEAFKKLVEVLAVLNGSELNYKSISNEIGIHVKTLKNYLSLLEKTYLIRLIKPFYSNKKKEILKSPKVYFLDLGTRNFFLKNYNPIQRRVDKGNIWETYILSEIIKNNSDVSINFWRTKQKQEVDFVLIEEKIIPVEVKHKSHGNIKDYSSLLAFMKEYSLKKGFVLNKNFLFNKASGDLKIIFLPAINFVKLLK